MKQLFDLDATPVEVKASLGDELLRLAHSLQEMRVAVILVSRWEHLQTRLWARSPGDKRLGKVRGGDVEDRDRPISLSMLGQHAVDPNGTRITGDRNLARGNGSPVQEAGADSIVVGVSKERVRATRTDIARPVGGDTKTKWPPSER